MPHVGTITGSMVLDPSQYIAGLGQAASATRSFQMGASSISFAGFNRGVIATTTLLYGLNRIMSSMSQGMEEYSNLLGKIGTVADLTASSVQALADSMKSLSTAQGVGRKDIMQGMYTAAQSRFSTPAEMRAMGGAAAMLSRASGKEINAKDASGLLSGLRQSLGIKMDAVTSGRMTDILLKGRDVGRWELKEMGTALGKVTAVYGNQFNGKIGGEEVLRQLVSMMSVASLSNLPLGMVSTGTRRLIERTMQLSITGRGDPLRQELRKAGFRGQDPILDAMNQGPLKFANTLVQLTGGTPSELNRLGYQARELQAVSSLLREQGVPLNKVYGELGYGNIAGTTGRYAERMNQTYGATRDKLRAEWEITSQEFMSASIPLIGQFTDALAGLNKVARMLPDSAKGLLMFAAAATSLRYFLNLLGFRGGALGGNPLGHSGGALPAGFTGAIPGGPLAHAMSKARSAASAPAAAKKTFSALPAEQASAARLARRAATASGRAWSGRVSPYSHQYSVHPQDRGISAAYRGNESLSAQAWLGAGANNGQHGRYVSLLKNRYFLPGKTFVQTPYGPTIEQRIQWAAYKQGQRIHTDSLGRFTGQYGSLTPSMLAYQNRGVPQGSLSVRELAALRAAQDRQLLASPLPANIGARGVQRRMDAMYAAGTLPSQRPYVPPPAKPTPVAPYGSVMNQMGRYAGARAAFGAAGYAAAPQDYASMGIGKTAVGLENLSGKIGALGSAVWGTLGPIMKMTIAFALIGKTIEAWNYKGQDNTPNEGRKPFRIDGKSRPSLWDTWSLGYGAIVGSLKNGTKNWGSRIDDFAREHGLVPDTGGGAGRSWRTDTPLPGYRVGGIKDVGGAMRREQLTPYEVRRFSAAGINFDKPETWTPYLSRYIKQQRNEDAPLDWDSFTKESGGTYKLAEEAAQSLRFFAAELDKTAKHLADVRAGRLGATLGDFTSDFLKNRMLEGRVLGGKQWDIYQSTTDWSGQGVNWSAGGKDWKANYAKNLALMKQKFGLFAERSPALNAEDAIAGTNKVWDRRQESFNRANDKWTTAKYGEPMTMGPMDAATRANFFETMDPYGIGVEPYMHVGPNAQMRVAGKSKAKFAGVETSDEIKALIGAGKQDASQIANVMKFFEILPNIRGMDEASALAKFKELTGRDPATDVYARTNFDNFRNIREGDFLNFEQTTRGSQYAGATQFGSAEAYNELLRRDSPQVEIRQNFEKANEYLKQLTVSDEEKDKALDDVMQRAKIFFEAAEDKLFKPLKTLAEDVE